MAKTAVHHRLPRNFHRTFKPERHYINAMLRYAASGQKGDYQAIGAATGIPTGVSTGKVPAILDYCRGMGLVRLVGPARSAIREPELTPFGRAVLLDDPYLKTEVSQWIAHFNLCSPVTGADVWYHTFFSGMQALGMSFARSVLELHLSVLYGTEKGNLIGPLIGSYEDEAALGTCGALSEKAELVIRRPAPLVDELALAYGAWILALLADHFPKQRQVSVTELDAAAGWRTIPGWDATSVVRALELVERKGLLAIDRHMEPWFIAPGASVEETWGRIYDELL